MAWAALVPACLNLEEAEPARPSDGGSGSGGSGVADSSWGGSAGSGGGAAGSGGFSAAPCDSCADGGSCECVPQAPQGWSHVRLADGSTKSCPDGPSSLLVVGSGAVDTGCGACECGSASGGGCGFRLRHYSYTGCAGSYTWAIVYNDVGQCENGIATGGPVMLDAYGYGGSCAPGTAQPKPATFAQTKSLCIEKSGGACGKGGACVRAQGPAFEDRDCVAFDSQGVDVACPASYPDKLSYSTGFDDTRKCTCDCKPSLSCSGGSAVFDCSASAGNDAGKCVDAAAAGDFKVTALPTLQSADCSPDTPATKSGGSVTASGLRVVCCR